MQVYYRIIMTENKTITTQYKTKTSYPLLKTKMCMDS